MSYWDIPIQTPWISQSRPNIQNSTTQFINSENQVYFLLVTHGFSLGKEENFYNFPVKQYNQTKFKRFDFFSQHDINLSVPDEFYIYLQQRRINPNITEEFYLNKIVAIPRETIPIKQTTNDRAIIPLPSVVFGSIESDLRDIAFSEMMGIRMYHVSTGWKKITSVYDLVQFRNANHTVMTYSHIFNGINNFIKKPEHSAFFQGKEIFVGIYCCRGFNSKYANELLYKTRILFNEQEFYPNLRGTNILSKSNLDSTKRTELVPLLIKTRFDNTPFNNNASGVLFDARWESALVGIKHQGCGLNVLSLYNFMLQGLAREKACVLSMDGTSIFRLVEYLHKYLLLRCNGYLPASSTSNNPIEEIARLWLVDSLPRNEKVNCIPSDTKYIVLRSQYPDLQNISDERILDLTRFQYVPGTQYPVNMMDQMERIQNTFIQFISLFKYLFTFSYTDNSALVVKFYRGAIHGSSFNHRGHTVSFYFRKQTQMVNGVLQFYNIAYLVDPQANRDIVIYRHSNTVYEQITGNFLIFLKNFTCFDIIWTTSFLENPSYISMGMGEETNTLIRENSVQLTIPSIFSFPFIIVPYEEYIIHGGSSRRRKSSCGKNYEGGQDSDSEAVSDTLGLPIISKKEYNKIEELTDETTPENDELAIPTVSVPELAAKYGGGKGSRKSTKKFLTRRRRKIT